MTRSSPGSPRTKTTPDPPQSGRHDLEKTSAPSAFRIVTLGACGMACLIALLPAAGHDQMWCLYSARLVLHGAKLYGPEIFESNPPLIVWLSTVPSRLADWMHLPDTAVGKFFVLAIEAAVALTCWKILRLFRHHAANILLWPLAFVYIAIFAVMPARDFGQRDHILVLLCLPYVLSAALDAQASQIAAWQSAAMGLAASLGLALKPHQALIPITVELTLIAILSRRQGSVTLQSLRRPAPAVILACGLAYLLAIHIFTQAYFTQVIPILRETYWAFGHLNLWQLILESLQLHILAAVTFAALLVTISRHYSFPIRVPPCHSAVGFRNIPTVLTAAATASTLAYYTQGTGWYYQQIPALSFFALALTFILIETAGQITLPPWTPNAALALTLVALALTAHFAGYPFTQARSFPIDIPAPSFFAALPPGTPVATFTTTVDDTVPPAFRYHLTIAQRYPHLWMLPAILRAESREGKIKPAQLAELEHLQHRAMLEDFTHWRPQLVLVERCQDPAVHCQVLEDRHDNLLAWFERDPAFQSEFSKYRYLRSAGPFDAYVPK